MAIPEGPPSERGRIAADDLGVYSDGAYTGVPPSTSWDELPLKVMYLIMSRIHEGEYRAAGQQWTRIAQVLRTMHDGLVHAGDALIPHWPPQVSDAADYFFEHVSVSLWSMSQWAVVADTNAATLSRVADDVARARADFTKKYNDYLAEVAAATAPPPAATAADGRAVPNPSVSGEEHNAWTIEKTYQAQCAKILRELGSSFQNNIVRLSEGNRFAGPTQAVNPAEASQAFQQKLSNQVNATNAANAAAAQRARAAQLAAQQRLAAEQAALQQRLAAEQAARQRQFAAEQATLQRQLAAEQATLQQRLAAEQAALQQQLADAQAAGAALATAPTALTAAQLLALGRAAPQSSAEMPAGLTGPGRPIGGATGLQGQQFPTSLRSLPAGLDPGTIGAGGAGAFGAGGASLPGGLRGAPAAGGLTGTTGMGGMGGNGIRGRLGSAPGPGGGVPAGQPPLSGRRQGDREQKPAAEPRHPGRGEREDHLVELPAAGQAPTGRLLADRTVTAVPLPPPDLTARRPGAPGGFGGPSGPQSGRGRQTSGRPGRVEDLSGRRRLPDPLAGEEDLVPTTQVPQDLTGRRPSRAPEHGRVAAAEIGTTAELLGTRGAPAAARHEVPGTHGSPGAGQRFAEDALSEQLDQPAEGLWNVETPEAIEPAAPAPASAQRRTPGLRTPGLRAPGSG